MKVLKNQVGVINEKLAKNKSFTGNSAVKSAVVATLLIGAPVTFAVANQNTHNDSFTKTELVENDEEKPIYEKKQNPEKELKKFNFNYAELYTKAKEAGIDIKHTIPDYPGFYESLNNLFYLDKEEQKSLKEVFKRYDDNENNTLDEEEVENFLEDAEQALEISPRAYPLTSNITLAKGNKIVKAESTSVWGKHHTYADHKAKAPIKAEKIENVVEYISYPKTERDGLRTTQKYIARENFAEILKITKKYKKLSLNSFSYKENLKAELKTTEQEIEKLKKSKNPKDTVLAEFKRSVISKLLELRPGESVTYVINQVGDQEYLDSKRKIFKYTIEKKHFNKLDVKQGEYKPKG